MIGAAIRSRLFELRRDRAAAQRSAELLERKREVLLREMLRRARRQAELAEALRAAYAAAERKLSIARVELGLPAIESAALAQPELLSIATKTTSVMGVRLTLLEPSVAPYRALYGTATTTASLDEAGAAFAELLPLAVALAVEEKSLARIRVAMRKVTKLAGALRKVVLPRIEHDIANVIEGIEEEERDEAIRRSRWHKRPAEA